MPPYLRAIPKPRCQRCGRPATVEVFNTYNARIGTYCARDGALRVDELKRLTLAPTRPNPTVEGH